MSFVAPPLFSSTLLVGRWCTYAVGEMLSKVLSWAGFFFFWLKLLVVRSCFLSRIEEARRGFGGNV